MVTLSGTMCLTGGECAVIRLQKTLILFNFFPNPISIRVPKIPDTHSGVWNFLYTEGLERAAPVRRLVQKLRAGEQFLARGRVLQIADASGMDVDVI